MKRFIYVPKNLIGTNNEIPKKAIDLSNQTHLQLRLGSAEDEINLSDIDIISIPEKIFLDYQKKVEEGYIQSIDYTNEFIDFNKNYFCKIKNKEKELTFNPRLVEKHCLKFRFRIFSIGQYYFDIIDENNNVVVSDEFFEVV